MNSFQAVFFDFDGTLADSYPAIASSVNHVRAHNGLPPLPENHVRRFVGRGPLYLLENTVPGSDPKVNLQLYREHHPTVMHAQTKLLPGAAELVSYLKSQNNIVALCSNKPRMYSEELLAHLGLREKFDLILGPEDVVHHKPAPDMIVEAMERLQLKKDGVLYVGDMSVDIQTARGAGVAVWVVPTGSESQEVLQDGRPDRVLRDLHEAAALLQN